MVMLPTSPYPNHDNLLRRLSCLNLLIPLSLTWSDGSSKIDGTTGVRYARNCHPDDLWTSYFTSSKHVKSFREQHGEPDIIEVRQTFNDSLQAREWEEKVLRRLNSVKSQRWLNRQNAGKELYLSHHSEKTKIKISSTLKRKTKTTSFW